MTNEDVFKAFLEKGIEVTVFEHIFKGIQKIEINTYKHDVKIILDVIDLIDSHLWNYSHEVWEDFKPILEQLKEQKTK